MYLQFVIYTVIKTQYPTTGFVPLPCMIKVYIEVSRTLTSVYDLICERLKYKCHVFVLHVKAWSDKSNTALDGYRFSPSP